MKKLRSIVRGLADDPSVVQGRHLLRARVRSFYDTGGDGIGDFPV
jgi:hypothetical protein